MERLTDLELLSAFVAVAEERHFGRAAQRLHVAQPVISRRIQRLERTMGVALLERTSRHVTLTEAGTTFLDAARHLLHSAELAVMQARRVAEGGAGRLTVGFVDSVAFALLTPLLHELATRVPDIAVDLRELSTEEQLSELDVDVDIAIVREVGEHELSAQGLFAQHLLRERLLVAVAPDHPLADEEEAVLTALADDGFVMFPRPQAPRLHDHLLAVCDRAGFRPAISAHAAQYPTMLAMVAAGRGDALVPACVRSIAPTGVRLLALRDEHAVSDLQLAWRGPASPALSTFVDAAVAVAARADGPSPQRRTTSSSR
jgi:DNA-binding transcriptional LysR family regulator